MRPVGLLLGVLVLSLTVPACAQDGAFPVSVMDDRGEAILIEQLPKRVISLNALYTQIMVDLGISDRLIAVGASDDNPASVAALPTVGPAFSPNVELILGFEPDLVLGANDWGGERPALESAGIAVLTTPWLTSVVSIFDTIRTVSVALGSGQAGEVLIGGIASHIVAEEARVLGTPAVTTAFLYAASPTDPPYAAGGDAIEHELILRASGVNVFAELEWSPQVSFEEILARNPAVIFTAPSQIENILEQPLLQTVDAVANGRVVGIRASDVASTLVADALHAMITGLHGEVP